MGEVIANIELLGVCEVLLILLFAFNIKYWRPKIINPLSCIYIMTMLGCVFEGYAFFANGKPDLIWLNYLSNIAYLSTIGFLGAFMLSYCNGFFPKPIWKSRLQHVLMMIPLDIELVLLFTSPKTGLIINVTSDGMYHRSATFVFQLIPYGYLIVSTVIALYWWRKVETIVERNQFLATAIFAIPPFVLGAVQLLIPANKIDVLEFSITLSLLANYMVSQRNRITRDALTGLHNREAFETRLVESMRDHRRGGEKTLCVMVGDLDSFKSINDTYGHYEGDKALIITGKVLMEISTKYRLEVARYGGDEFAICCEIGDTDDPETIINEINEKLAESSVDSEYQISMSIGYAMHRASDTVHDIMKAADRELYRVKAEKHVLR